VNVRKLANEYRAAITYPPHDPQLPVICVDLDGTLAESVWPSPAVGPLDLDALRLVQHYYEEGCEVHILTARPESHFPRIWKWLEKHAIDHMIYTVTNRKPVARWYFDDRSVAWPL